MTTAAPVVRTAVASSSTVLAKPMERPPQEPQRPPRSSGLPKPRGGARYGVSRRLRQSRGNKAQPGRLAGSGPRFTFGALVGENCEERLRAAQTCFARSVRVTAAPPDDAAERSSTLLRHPSTHPFELGFLGSERFLGHRVVLPAEVSRAGLRPSPGVRSGGPTGVGPMLAGRGTSRTFPPGGWPGQSAPRPGTCRTPRSPGGPLQVAQLLTSRWPILYWYTFSCVGEGMSHR